MVGRSSKVPAGDARAAQLARALLIRKLCEREADCHGPRLRIPEPMVMNDAISVEAFDRAGADTGPMVPLYEVSARSVSRLLPHGGTVLELGSGSARGAVHLAMRRPDATVIGIDLADTMLTLGRQLVTRLDLTGRVMLRDGDMTDIDALGLAPPAVVMASMSLHHLPDDLHLQRCFASIARLVERCGCAVWMLDLARLRSPESYRTLLDASDRIDGRLRVDALASEAAAWTLDEAETALSAAELECRSQALSPLPLVQSHWRFSSMGPSRDHERSWTVVPLSREVSAEAQAIERQLGVGSTRVEAAR